MRREQLSGLRRRKRGHATIRVPGVRLAPDLVERDFSPTARDRLWAADIPFAVVWPSGTVVAMGSLGAPTGSRGVDRG